MLYKSDAVIRRMQNLKFKSSAQSCVTACTLQECIFTAALHKTAKSAAIIFGGRKLQTCVYANSRKTTASVAKKGRERLTVTICGSENSDAVSETLQVHTKVSAKKSNLRMRPFHKSPLPTLTLMNSANRCCDTTPRGFQVKTLSRRKISKLRARLFHKSPSPEPLPV